MKRKSKLMLGISALLVAAGAVGVTGTFAWFQQTGTANITPASGTTASVDAVNGVANLGTFTVTASAKANPGSVRLTDASGNTYLWDGASNNSVTDNGNAMAEVTIQIAISYSGALSNDSDIAALWDDTVDAQSAYKITCEDATDYTVNTGGTATKNTPAAIKTAASTTKKYGLKFGANATTYDTGYVLNGTVSKVDVTFGKAEIKSKTFSSGSVAAFDLTTKVYVGVWGIDGFTQLEDDAYVAKFTPKFS